MGDSNRGSVFADRAGCGLCVERIPCSARQAIRLEHLRSNAHVYDQHFCAGLCRIFGGLWLNRKGPRVVALTGGTLYGLGVFLTSFSANNLWWLYFSYGFIGGLGLGLGYIVPVAVLVKWFPDRRGLITGVAVGGFGGGALITAPVATRLIDPKDVAQVFLPLGIAYLVAILIGGSFFRNPPQGYSVPGFVPAQAKVAGTADT